MPYRKGVAFPRQGRCFYCCETLFSLRTGWWFDWMIGDRYVCPNCGKLAFPAQHPAFVPMSWIYGDILDIVGCRIPGGPYLVNNEPDWKNIDPVAAAAEYFERYNAIRALDGTAQIGGIGVVGIDANGECRTGPWSIAHDGACWLWAFLAHLNHLNVYCEGHARLHFFHAHAYYIGWLEPWRRGGAANSAGTAVTFERMRKHIQYCQGPLRSTFPEVVVPSVPIWITEVARQAGDVQQNRDLMATLCNWLEDWGFDEGRVERVAWFPTRHPNWINCSLFEANFQDLTPLGEDWRAFL